MRDCEQGGDILTQDGWIPDQAYSMAHNFRERHGDELSADLVNELLKGLNAVYRDRERKTVQRIKKESREELNQLKRKLMYRPTYDEMQTKRTINSLKRQLKNNNASGNAEKGGKGKETA